MDNNKPPGCITPELQLKRLRVRSEEITSAIARLDAEKDRIEKLIEELKLKKPTRIYLSKISTLAEQNLTDEERKAEAAKLTKEIISIENQNEQLTATKFKLIRKLHDEMGLIPPEGSEAHAQYLAALQWLVGMPPPQEYLKDLETLGKNIEVSARALVNMEAQQTTESLMGALDYLDDEDEDVRLAAAKALVNVSGEITVTPLTNNESWLVAAGILVTIGTLAKEPLINVLGDEFQDVQLAAAKVLAVEPLIKALEDESEEVRAAAAEALVNVGNGRAVEPLIKALEDENRHVRQFAAEALGEIGDVRAVEPLIKTLEYKNAVVQWAVAGALGAIGDASVEELLIKALSDKDSDIQRMANDPRDIKPLIKSLGVRLSAIQKAAQWTLVKMGASVVEPLIEALADEPLGGQGKVAETLGKIGAPAVEPLIEALADAKRAAQEAMA